MTESNRFWLLVSRKLANEATEENLDELEQIIHNNPDFKARYEALLTYWQQTGRKKHIDVNAALQKTLHSLDTEDKLPESKPPFKRINFSLAHLLRIAAIMSFILSTGSMLYYFSIAQSGAPDFITKQNEKGMRSEILLSDGSTVWLNADSEIHYPKVFGSHTREIHLSGEAYFDIVSDTTCPFIIHLKNNEIRVLGTSFNVKAYKEYEFVETTVVSGKVAFICTSSLASANPKDTLLLTPNYKALYSKQTGTLTKTLTDTHVDTAWKERKLIFRSTRFEEVGKILERTYGKEVIFSNQAIKQCRLTATFQNNSLEETMILIAKTNDYAYEITEDKLTISGKGCE